MNSRLLTMTLLVLPLLLFIGCGKEDPSENTVVVTDNEQVVSSTPIQQAYLNCTTKGYDIQLQYDEAHVKPLVYCVFPDGNECLALDFLNGSCGEESAADNAQLEQLIFDNAEPLSALPRYCEPIADPVCGADGRTYTNECVAALQGAQVVHIGACDSPAPTRNADTLETRPGQKESSRSSGSTGSNEENQPRTSIAEPSTPTAQTPTQASADDLVGVHPAWLDVLIGVTDADPALPSARIERCVDDGEITYFQRSAFPTLFDEDGEVVCYPGHDLNQLCPDWVGNAGNRCSIVWQK